MSSTTGNRSQISFPTTGITTKGQAMLLAIDDVSLPLKYNLCYYMTKPSLHPEPVLTPSRDNPDAVDYIATHFYGTVLYDQGKFRMWYYPTSLGRNPDMSPEQKALTEPWWQWRQTQTPVADIVWPGPVAYAESDDGIEWTKPNLGQLLFKGNRDNNGLDLPDALIEGVHVIRDDDDPDPNRRYKMICNVMPPPLPTLRTHTSPDGIHWTAGPQSCIGGDFFEEASFYKFNGLYFVNGQIGGYPLGLEGRTLARCLMKRTRERPSSTSGAMKSTLVLVRHPSATCWWGYTASGIMMRSLGRTLATLAWSSAMMVLTSASRSRDTDG